MTSSLVLNSDDTTEIFSDSSQDIYEATPTQTKESLHSKPVTLPEYPQSEVDLDTTKGRQSYVERFAAENREKLSYKAKLDYIAKEENPIRFNDRKVLENGKVIALPREVELEQFFDDITKDFEQSLKLSVRNNTNVYKEYIDQLQDVKNKTGVFRQNIKEVLDVLYASIDLEFKDKPEFNKYQEYLKRGLAIANRISLDIALENELNSSDRNNFARNIQAFLTAQKNLLYKNKPENTLTIEAQHPIDILYKSIKNYESIEVGRQNIAELRQEDNTDLGKTSIKFKDIKFNKEITETLSTLNLIDFVTLSFPGSTAFSERLNLLNLKMLEPSTDSSKIENIIYDLFYFYADDKNFLDTLDDKEEASDELYQPSNFDVYKLPFQTRKLLFENNLLRFDHENRKFIGIAHQDILYKELLTNTSEQANAIVNSINSVDIPLTRNESIPEVTRQITDALIKDYLFGIVEAENIIESFKKANLTLTREELEQVLRNLGASITDDTKYGAAIIELIKSRGESLDEFLAKVFRPAA